jgi:flagellar hook-length control protein FliK
VPSVASQTNTQALKPPAPTPRAPERAPAAPFASLLDEMPQTQTRESFAPLHGRSTRDTRPEPHHARGRDDAAPAERNRPAESEPAGRHEGSEQADAAPDTDADAANADTADAAQDAKPADEMKVAETQDTPEIEAGDQAADTVTPVNTDKSAPSPAPATAAPVSPAAPTPLASNAPDNAVTSAPESQAVQGDRDAGKAGVPPPATTQAGDHAKPATDDVPIAAKEAAPGEPEVKPTHAEAETKPATPVRAETQANRAAAESATPATQPAAKAPDVMQPQVLPAPQSMPPAAYAAPAAAAAPQATPQPADVPMTGVAVEIAGKALAGKNRFEIRLDPPELGRIDVRLDVDREGRVSSHLIVHRTETLDLLRRDAAGLERALHDAGLKTADNGLQFSLRDQSAQDGQDTGTSGGHSIVIEDDLPGPADVMQTANARLAQSRGGLDIRV